VPEKREKEDEKNYHGEVHSEVREVGFEARNGVAEVVRERYGVVVKDLLPWPPHSEGSVETLLSAGHVVELRRGG